MYTDYISPYIRLATDNTLFPPVAMRDRAIFDYELLYIKSGRARITIDGRTYEARDGDAFLIKPGRIHSMYALDDRPLRQPHIHFDLFQRADSPEVGVSFKLPSEMSDAERAHFRRDVLARSPLPLPDKLMIRDIHTFEVMLFDIIREYEAKLPFSMENAKGLFIGLWVFLLREQYMHLNPIMELNYDRLMEVKRHIAENIHRNMTLKELSQMANISGSHLVRLFQRMFGISPIHHHKSLRIQRAKQWLQYTDMSISAIADALGFNSIHAFTRTFTRMEGIAPSRYREGVV